MGELKNLNLEKGYFNKPYEKKGYGATYMHLAAAYSSQEILKYMIMHDGNVNIRNNYGATPIFDAIEYCNIENLRILIKNNANINIKDDKGITPLHRAVNRCSFHITYVQELLESGADIYIEDNSGKTAYEIATENRDLYKNWKEPIYNHYHDISQLIEKYEVKSLASKVNQLELKNSYLEKEMAQMQANIKTLMSHLKLENDASNNNKKSFGMFF